MEEYTNPFEYEAAANLPPQMVLDVYVEDHNYTRFIRSRRNLFLVGERGSGKSMTLLYNSFKYQGLKASREGKRPSLDFVGIYIPCNTPLTHKQEYLLIDNDFHAALISEHYLVLSILYAIGETLQSLKDTIPPDMENEIRAEAEVVLGSKLPDSRLSDSLRTFSQAEVAKTQRSINCCRFEEAFRDSIGFASAILPLLILLKRVDALRDSNFLLMLDDAHDLNKWQKRAVNSWMAYRDHSVFSLKVAAAKVGEPDYHTLSGGSILEGHDFIIIDLEQPFQNMASPFAKLAKEIIQKRLRRSGIDATPESFFPTNPEFLRDMEAAEEKTRQEALKKYTSAKTKTVTDYVYKYARAEYFRSRSTKANLPPYSGLETIIHISTGVIRNLLDPCYWMYDHVYSTRQHENAPISAIPPAVQTQVLQERSEQLWKRLEEGLDKSIENCTVEQGKQIFRLMDNLAVLFRGRLLRHKSEPRAIAFTISSMDDDDRSVLLPLLDIARRAQLLYTRYGPAKDEGRRETYYVPNRMLWPIRGLDPNGQHARVSLKASDILAAANGVRFPFVAEDEVVQGEFF